MSREFEVAYEIEAAARERIVRERVSSRTEEFYRRYLEQYGRMKEQGFENYIPSEMNQLKSDLDGIRENLVSDPFEARDISMDVGNYIRTMWSMGKAARNQFEREERMREELRREQSREQLSQQQKRYSELVVNIDACTAHFALPALRSVKERIDSGQWDDSRSLDSEIRRIVAEAQPRADVWKREQREACRKDNMAETLAEAEEQMKHTPSVNREVNDAFLERIGSLKRRMQRGEITVEEASVQLHTIKEQADEALISEEVRREAVRSICQQLKKQEFSVTPPEWIERNGKRLVRIVARKPSGKTAVCQIGSDGKLMYRFDQYEGMTCIKDIEKFSVELEKIYSVKLSDERVLWENPNRLSKDSVNNTTSKGGNV